MEAGERSSRQGMLAWRLLGARGLEHIKPGAAKAGDRINGQETLSKGLLAARKAGERIKTHQFAGNVVKDSVGRDGFRKNKHRVFAAFNQIIKGPITIFS